VLTIAPEEQGNVTVCVIIVTHNSERVIRRCLERIQNQTSRPDQIIIVDSGSEKTGYLDEFRSLPGCTVHLSSNRGFGAANNLGLTLIGGSPSFIIFANPDTFLERTCIEDGIEIMSQYPDIAMLTGTLKEFDVKTGQPTGKLDSTGFFRKWYGRWYDRDQGAFEQEVQRTGSDIPAICGAFMLCRREALEPEYPELFDESFYLYKEDIDLSIRIRKKGWRLFYTPELEVFHGRGWERERKQIDREIRLMAAHNEIRLCFKHRSPYILWALSKYMLVRVFNV
jgi:N-acetylglucosaminyl-diphospho-decaprenol L-rhamnosyltransferase